ncbi:3-phosphoshikimate 1-carboxyvinyltransferase [Aequorivita viscosa]|uniref:3-phosphoshikimate 1-carboxyvinyltransferase n=1 Tax=Aequorivita viscosa TaxID=797419 RepID=A0A1M6CQL4_9FLAO|nr:3-phosphoshikimate 1-carboxyvinyltransferase [Aequorivita viscosa]SDW39526.1 3-phosphoshikimate 1-carboxyvinyltransferase [Aequorivita viscosa]SHI63173.1 3-phosphoshikimate 1-carboxyvinyltransferase [Aequorivita viscosa]
MKAILGRGKFPKNSIINIGGSKSESNRLLILKAQFQNITIKNLSESDDTNVLQQGLKTVNGTVNVHHAGTAMRFLTAYFAAKEGAEIILTGSSRMQERPIGVLVDALNNLGADIQYLQNEGYPPLKIKGKKLQKRNVAVQADISSQYISALMLIAPMLPNGLEITLKGKTISKPYIEMTLSLLKQIGVQANFHNNIVSISSLDKIEAIEIIVESDWSAASYFYSLVALSEDLEITLTSFSEDSLQGDAALSSIYKKLGVQTVFNTFDNSISLSKKNKQLPDSLKLNLTNTPDLAQTVAVTCFGLGIACELTGLQTLKIKETDRLSALQIELTKLGAVVHIDCASIRIRKSTQLVPNVIIETYQDHRMAMAFAPLALKTPLRINNAGVVSKSYPNFWKDLKKTGISCELLKTTP